MKILLFNLFIASTYFTEPVESCKLYVDGPKDCDLWLKELGASTTDDKTNVMYDDRLTCAENLVTSCGAEIDFLKKGNTLKTILNYKSKPYYFYTDEETANQKLGYIGDDDDDDDDD